MTRYNRPFTFDRVVRILITTAVIIGIFLFINRISGALLPFLLAWLLAYMVNPVVEFFQYRLKIRNRLASILIGLTAILILLGGFIALVIPSVKAEVSKFIALVGQYGSTPGKIPFIPQEWLDSLSTAVNWQEIISHHNKEDFMDILDKILPGAVKFFSGSVNLIVGIVASSIIFLYFIFILLDYDKIAAGFVNLIPPKYKKSVLSIAGDIKDSMNRYFRGQAVVAFLVGILFSIGFKIIGMPLAVLLGLFIGLLNMVPYLQIVGFIPTLLLCWLKSAETGGNFWLIVLAAAIVFIVVQAIQDMIIVPKVMGKITGLNPAIILLSLSIWGSLMGLVGMIIALPMTSLILSYYQRFFINREKIYKENDPES